MTTRKALVLMGLVAAGSAGILGAALARVRHIFATTFDVDVSGLLGRDDEWLRDIL